LSQHIESKFDRNVEDFELTVTSVGLTAPFKTLRQYKKFEGKEVEVLTKKGDKLRGVLKSADEDRFTITVTKKIKQEGVKRKTEIQEDMPFAYDEIKYTKYHLRFK
jgi:ribosome maturation factor RimP